MHLASLNLETIHSLPDREGGGRVLCLCAFLSRSSATCVTGHLDLANDDAGAGDEFETFEAEFADLDGLAELEVGDIDVQTLGDGGVYSLHLQLADAGGELTTSLDTS